MKKFLIIFTLLISPAAFADTDSENQNLSRIMREVEYLISEVNVIKADAPRDTRIRFEYDLLIEDLLKVRHGIADHVNGSLDASRPIKPINGIYRR